MVLLGIECSASAASCAIIRDGSIIAKAFTNVKLTHSETLLPMVKNMLDSAKLSIDDIDCFAIAAGPGSFTGIRIGISAVKGMATAKGKPCVGVSTLEAMAYMQKNTDCLICAVMDARCNQFYNAIFEIKGGCVCRLTDDRALLFEELCDDIKANYADKKIFAVGDGASVFTQKCRAAGVLDNVSCAAENILLQQADGVVLLGERLATEGKAVSAEALLPYYLRLPQAERELKKRKEENI